MLTEIGVKFGMKDGDSALKMIDRMGTSFGGLSRETDKAVSQVAKAEAGLKGHFGRISAHVTKFRGDLKSGMASIGQFAMSTKGMMTMGAGALVGGGIAGAPFALAASRAPVTKELSKYIPAGLSKADIAEVEKQAGKLTGEIPYLTTTGYLDGMRELYKKFQDYPIEMRHGVGEAAARGSRVLDIELKAFGHSILKFDETFGKNISDKKAYTEKFTAQVLEAYQKSPAGFKPEHLAQLEDYLPQLKQMGWKQSQVLALGSVLGESGIGAFGRITAGGPKLLAEMLAMGHAEYTDPKKIEELKARGTPQATQYAKAFEHRNKEIAEYYQPLTRNMTRLGPDALMKGYGMALEGLQKRFPDKVEDIVSTHLGVRPGTGVSTLYKGIQAAKEGKIREIEDVLEKTKYSKVLKTQSEMDEGIDAKLELLKQRFKKFAVGLAKIMEKPVRESTQWLGKELQGWSQLWSENSQTIAGNVDAALQGFKTGIASLAGTDTEGLRELIKGYLTAPDPEGWKAWGEGVGKWLGKVRTDIESIAQSVTTVSKAINTAADLFGGKEKKPEEAGSLLSGMPRSISDVLQYTNPWWMAKARAYSGLGSDLFKWGAASEAPKPVAPFGRAPEPQSVLRPETVPSRGAGGGLPGNLELEVKVEPEVKVYLGDREIRDLIRVEVEHENARFRRGYGDNALGFGMP